MAVRILIADDHEIVRQGIRAILRERPEWEICDEAVNGTEAVKKARESKPDLIILDMTMPGLSGIEATKEITKADPAQKVLMFTMHESKTLGDAVLRAGASGYVFKSRAARDLILAIETVLGGDIFFRPETLTISKTKDDKSGAVLLYAWISKQIAGCWMMAHTALTKAVCAVHLLCRGPDRSLR